MEQDMQRLLFFEKTAVVMRASLLANTSGRMEGNTKTIRRKALALLHLETVYYMKEC
jgi:hypothetical protein